MSNLMLVIKTLPIFCGCQTQKIMRVILILIVLRWCYLGPPLCLQQHYKHNSQIARDIHQNLYVKNVISGSPTEESTIQYFIESRRIMSEANFNLRSWASNCQQLQANVRSNQAFVENQVVNVLGLQWNTTEDRICFIPKSLTSNSVVTI